MSSLSVDSVAGQKNEKNPSITSIEAALPSPSEASQSGLQSGLQSRSHPAPAAHIQNFWVWQGPILHSSLDALRSVDYRAGGWGGGGALSCVMHVQCPVCMSVPTSTALP